MMEQELGRRKPKSQMSRLNLFCLIMDPQKITIQSIKFGFYTGLSLIIFFLIMKIFGFHRNLDLHYLNMIFLFFGLMFSIRKIKLFSGELKYLEGLKKVLSEGNSNQLDTIPLQLPEGQPSYD